MSKKNKQYISAFLKLFKDNKFVVFILIGLGLLADIFFFKGSSDIRIFTILGFSIFSIIIYKLNGKTIFSLCLILLLIMFGLFVFSGTSTATEKAAVWFVLFFGVGIVRQWKE